MAGAGRNMVTGRAALLVLILGAGAACPSPPERVVSINLCTDQLAMLVGAEGQIRSVSWLAGDPSVSLMADEARAIGLNHARAEEIFLLAPDLVLAGTYTARPTVEMLTRLGLRVETVAPVNSTDELRAAILDMGELLGQPATARRLLDDFDARMAALPGAGAQMHQERGQAGAGPAEGSHERNGARQGDMPGDTQGGGMQDDRQPQVSPPASRAARDDDGQAAGTEQGGKPGGTIHGGIARGIPQPQGGAVADTATGPHGPQGGAAADVAAAQGAAPRGHGQPQATTPAGMISHSTTAGIAARGHMEHGSAPPDDPMAPPQGAPPHERGPLGTAAPADAIPGFITPDIAAADSVARNAGAADRGGQGIGRPPLTRPRATTYGANGFAAGPDSLQGDVMRRAGLDLLAGELGLSGGGQIALEQLIMAAPDIIVTGSRHPLPSRAEAIADHPAIAALPARRVMVADRDWLCGLPAVAGVAERLAQ
ncbi:MAG: hypothetical protein Q4G25_04255 [Paracoccus sp. (in: a-proteobacteria)]|nr:hypothetical protein [Paracoccus sp. (in: a-proteobacteria)]